ncbi:MAG TPA: choice-of-anchor Q domain-containing protein [Solirubrobacterales bacterium]
MADDAPASAAPFVVTSTADSGDGSLRKAISDANANGQTDQITFGVTGTIALTSGTLQITSPMTITGPGPDQLAVTGNSMTSPLFAVTDATGQTVRIERLKIADARATAFAAGGVGKNGTGELQLDTVWLFDNFAASGGAVWAGEGLTRISNSTIDNNHANFGGGAIALTKGFGPNPGTMILTNSTVTANGSNEFGGAINVALGGTLTILSSTIAGNTANEDMNISGDGGGIYNNASTVNIANTILAGNSVGAGAPSSDGQCAGAAFASAGYNLRSAADPNCNGFTATGDFVDANPMLGMLGMNGGLTRTIPLLAGSPAIEAGNPSPPGDAFPLCPTADQRGLPRGGAAGTCDIGAFEVQPPPPPQPPPPAPGSAGTGTQARFNLKKAIKRCKRKFPKGKKRKRCIKRAKKRARA